MTISLYWENQKMRMVFPTHATGRFMDDLANDVGTLVETLFHDVAGNESVQREPGYRAPLDIHESERDYVIALDVPGVALESIEIDLHEDTLKISGVRQAPGWRPPTGEDAKADTAESPDNVEENVAKEALKQRRRERSFGRFERRIQLPLPVEQDAVTAELSDGVLEVRLPKADPESGKRRVPISRG